MLSLDQTLSLRRICLYLVVERAQEDVSFVRKRRKIGLFYTRFSFWMYFAEIFQVTITSSSLLSSCSGALSRDLLISTGKGNAIKIWTVTTGYCVKTL